MKILKIITIKLATIEIRTMKLTDNKMTAIKMKTIYIMQRPYISVLKIMYVRSEFRIPYKFPYK